MRYGLAYVPEDRRQQGLVMDFSIAANMTLPILQQLSRFGVVVNRQREREIATDYSQQLRVRSAGIDQPVKALSGGNQQKVVLAKWLIPNPKILILDEPTRGVDIGAKAEVHRIVSDLASKGLAIILISSELPEVLAMSDRVLVMHEGHFTAMFDRAEANQEKVMFAATGQVLPFSTPEPKASPERGVGVLNTEVLPYSPSEPKAHSLPPDEPEASRESGVSGGLSTGPERGVDGLSTKVNHDDHK
jgi:rhamnose transport system ATP-binding protein